MGYQLNSSFKKEITERFHHDIQTLTIKKLIAKPDATIVSIKKMGDSHYEGRAVALVNLRAKSLSRIIYKPHSLEMGVAFGQFIKWVNLKTRLGLKSPDTVSCGPYGWSKYISPKPCRTQEEVETYYKKLGALSGIFLFLLGTDIHHENIIAHGNTPYVVDLETLLTPSLTSTEVPHLIVYTAMIPRWRATADKTKWVDKSAFSGFYNHKRKTRHHIPKLGKKTVNPYDYTKSFLTGFKKIAECFIDCKEQLLSEKNSPLVIFKNLETRLVVKDTAEYYAILKSKNLAGLVPYEIKALKNNSIPLLHIKTTEKTIVDASGDPVPFVAVKTGYERMIDYIRLYANYDNYVLQSNLIKQCFMAGFVNYKLKGKLSFESEANKPESVKAVLKKEINFIKKSCIKSGNNCFWPTLKKINDYWVPSKTSDRRIMMTLMYSDFYFQDIDHIPFNKKIGRDYFNHDDIQYWTPEFPQGAAGRAYQLMRLMKPKKIPHSIEE